MDFQHLFNLAVGAVGLLFGWVLNRITSTIDRLDTDVRALPLLYVSREDYRLDLKDVKEALIRIENKLDSKADK